MIDQAERRGDLQPGMTVVEYSGGSTGSSLAYVCAAKGYRLKVVSSDAFAEEKLQTMMALGAELTAIPSDGEGHTVVTVACDTGLKYLAGELFTDRARSLTSDPTSSHG